MLKTIAVMPLDDRPPNYEFPALLGQAAGYGVVMPPKEWLGTPWRDGRVDRLAHWLQEAAAGADALVIALDTLGYGGLVNSRRSTDSVNDVLRRLQVVRDLKARNPNLTILGYSILMRITRGNDAEEEKAYWATYGARMFRMSYLEDRLAMLAGNRQEDEAELARLRSEVPTDVVEDYRQGRARNHRINVTMVRWAAEGIFDVLIIPQDDTVEYGWNIAEARRLRLLGRQLQVTDRVFVYPGTDETDMLLLARYAARTAGFRPRIWTRYSSVRAGQILTAYEDRPMEEMVKAHLGPVGGWIAADPAQADILLYVNSPAEVQGNGFDQYLLALADEDLQCLPREMQVRLDEYRRSPGLGNTKREMFSVQRNLVEFCRSLAQAVAAGRSCAVVDVAYVNGGDSELFEELRRAVDLAQLAGFGGWNTAGNTLGTVLAHSVIRHLQRTRGASPEALAAHLKFLFLRCVDDALYQGPIRSQVALEVLPTLGIEPRVTDLGELSPQVEAAVAALLTEAAAELAEACFHSRTVMAGNCQLAIEQLGIRNVFLPWRRLFEVGCEVVLNGHDR